jgi:hypothetical protein
MAATQQIFAAKAPTEGCRPGRRVRRYRDVLQSGTKAQPAITLQRVVAILNFSALNKKPTGILADRRDKKGDCQRPISQGDFVPAKMVERAGNTARDNIRANAHIAL